jgi:hypothetical protein
VTGLLVPHTNAYLSGSRGRLEGVQHVEATPFLRRIKQLTFQPPAR